MKPSREPYHHGNLKSALVLAAVRRIEKEGQASFSLRETAREVGVSANAAYRHFDDKAALMLAAAAHGYELLSKHMLQAMDEAACKPSQEAPSIRAFKAVGRAYIDFSDTHPALFMLMFSESGIGCLTPSSAQPSQVNPWTLLGQSLDALMDDGLLPPARRPGAEMKAWAVVHGFASLSPGKNAGTVEHFARMETIEALLDFTVTGLCADLKPTQKRNKRRA